jgi:hypothetical protein
MAVVVVVGTRVMYAAAVEVPALQCGNNRQPLLHPHRT